MVIIFRRDRMATMDRTGTPAKMARTGRMVKTAKTVPMERMVATARKDPQVPLLPHRKSCWVAQ